MKKPSFLHVADVHLDSPLANLKRMDETTSGRLHRASRQGFESVVDIAIDRQVDAVVIAGDLFDGPIRDASAGLWVEGQFKRLTRQGIKVAMIRGNHDALSNARRVSHWPDGVYEFGANEPTSFIVDSVGIAVHGQSFGARIETDDLAANYPRPTMGMFNIGLLHTSLSGSKAHDTYAPTSVTTLENAGYDYWALGHIHVRSEKSLCSHCYVGYSGNTQGRHIREPGAKGCQLVQIQDGRAESIEFISTDSLRWHQIDVDVSELEYLRDIEDQLEQLAMPILAASDGRPLAVRVRIVGATTLHAELTRHGTTERLMDTLAARLKELGDIWLETVKIASSPFLAGSPNDMLVQLKYLSKVSGACRTDPQLQSELEDVLEELLKKARSDLSEYDWPLTRETERSAELVKFVGMAEDLLVARLAGTAQG